MYLEIHIVHRAAPAEKDVDFKAKRPQGAAFKPKGRRINEPHVVSSVHASLAEHS